MSQRVVVFLKRQREKESREHHLGFLGTIDVRMRRNWGRKWT